MLFISSSVLLIFKMYKYVNMTRSRMRPSNALIVYFESLDLFSSPWLKKVEILSFLFFISLYSAALLRTSTINRKKRSDFGSFWWTVRSYNLSKATILRRKKCALHNDDGISWIRCEMCEKKKREGERRSEAKGRERNLCKITSQ